jgi:hypothetical protein
MIAIDGYDTEQSYRFCARWLPAWTGNDPERLLSFYSEDAFYSDPAVPAGLTGHDALRSYFSRLLAAYPDWIWIHRRSLPVPDGFLNFWDARLSAAAVASTWSGVCVVQVREGLIFRNEVFLDRSTMPAPAGTQR